MKCTNLNAGVDLEAAFLSMGLQLPESDERRFPVKFKCPVCDSKRALVLKDRVFGGFWIYCQKCRIGQDLIEFYARVTGESLERAAGRLAPGASLSEISNYIVQHINARKEVNEYWSSNGPHLNPETDYGSRALAEKLNIKLRPEPGSWNARLRRFASFMDPQEIRKSLRVKKTFKDAFDHTNTAAFETPRAMVTPCGDLPGRICCFAITYLTSKLIGKCGNEVRTKLMFLRPGYSYDEPALRKAATRGLPGADKRPEIYETGCGSCEALFEGRHETLGRTRFFLFNLPLAIAMQSVHMYHSTSPLPVTGCVRLFLKMPWTSTSNWIAAKEVGNSYKMNVLWYGNQADEKYVSAIAAAEGAHVSSEPLAREVLTFPAMWLQKVKNSASKLKKNKRQRKFQ